MTRIANFTIRIEAIWTRFYTLTLIKSTWELTSFTIVISSTFTGLAGFVTFNTISTGFVLEITFITMWKTMFGILWLAIVTFGTISTVMIFWTIAGFTMVVTNLTTVAIFVDVMSDITFFLTFVVH
jgi:hypothetical protein